MDHDHEGRRQVVGELTDLLARAAADGLPVADLVEEAVSTLASEDRLRRRPPEGEPGPGAVALAHLVRGTGPLSPDSARLASCASLAGVPGLVGLRPDGRAADGGPSVADLVDEAARHGMVVPVDRGPRPGEVAPGRGPLPPWRRPRSTSSPGSS